MKSKLYEWFGVTMLTMSLLLAGCSTTTDHINSSQLTSLANAAVTMEAVEFEEEDLNSDWSESSSKQINLNGTSITTTAESGVFIEDTTVTIALPGTYVVSGELENGQIHVRLENKGNVQLVLNGATIHNDQQAAIYVEEAGKTIITLADGTENTVSDGGQYVFEDGADEPSGTIFSKDDLTINGTGSLKVEANYNNAIVSKDILKLVSGNYTIASVDDGIVGRDVLAIRNGSFTLNVEGDALKTTNDNADKLGKIYIVDGQFSIHAGHDGFDSIGAVYIENGQYSIITGGGSKAASLSDDSSAKGVKAATQLVVNNGSFTMDNADDAFHSNDSVLIANGQFNIHTGDDGIHADRELTIEDGEITVNESYEGLEAQQITIHGGQIAITATDDGINVAGGNDGSAFEGRAGASFSASSDALLKITGGQISVNAAGDGLDSNGNVEMTGGTVVVHGPEDNGNGALDYDGSFNITGGTLIAVGSSGMAMATSTQSTQSSILMYYTETQSADTLVQLVNEENEVLISFKPDKSYQSVMISSPLIESGKTYTLYTGGQSELDDKLQLGIQTPSQLGTAITSFTVSDIVTYVDENGITTGKSNMGGPRGMNGGFGNNDQQADEEDLGGRQGSRREGMTPPDGVEGELPAPPEEAAERIPPLVETSGDMSAPANYSNEEVSLSR